MSLAKLVRLVVSKPSLPTGLKLILLLAWQKKVNDGCDSFIGGAKLFNRECPGVSVASSSGMSCSSKHFGQLESQVVVQ